MNLFLLPIPVCFKRQKLMGMEMILSNWTIFLASKCAGPPAIQCSGRWNFVVGVPGHHLATQDSSSALQVMKSPLMSSRSSQNCRSTGGISKYELFLVNARAHDDGTNLRLPLPNSFHQENTLANREGGPTSNQQLWELVFCSTGWKLAYSFGKKGSCV